MKNHTFQKTQRDNQQKKWLLKNNYTQQLGLLYLD
jgi:hypothetical protein